MPSAKRPHVVKAVYEAASQLLAKRDAPTELIQANRVLYRAADLKYMTVNANGVFPRGAANQALVVRDGTWDTNRFSGISKVPGIQAAGGLYCAIQQAALVNELLHYTANQPGVIMNTATGLPFPASTFAQKFVVQIRLMHSLMVCDISPHNAASRSFLNAIGNAPTVQTALRQGGNLPISFWTELVDGHDCSAARGLGLAVAYSGYLHGLQAATVRQSDRALDESGDNVVLFGLDGQPLSGMWIECAYRFPMSGPPEKIPVSF